MALTEFRMDMRIAEPNMARPRLRSESEQAMSAREIAARKGNFFIGLIAFICLGLLLSRAPVQDEAENQSLRQHVEQQRRGDVGK